MTSAGRNAAVLTVAMTAGALFLFTPIVNAQSACLESHVNPNDPWPFKNFGDAVDIASNTAIVGAKWDNAQGTEAGAAYVFEWNGEEWVQQQKLLASDGESENDFGRDVVIQSNTAIIGAVGKAYVFNQIGGEWIEEQILIPEDGSTFGRALAIHNDVMVVGSMHDDTQGTSAGAAWVFRYNGTEWVEEQKLLASDGQASNFFGIWPAVDVYGDFIAIGAPGHPGLDPPKGLPPFFSAGAVYIFHYDGETWIEQQIIAPLSPQGLEDRTTFGEAVALDNGRVVAANADEDQLSTFIYEYNPDQEQWIQQQQIFPPPEGVPDGFGRAVDIEGDTVLIGDWLSTPGSGGAAFIYHDSGNEDEPWQLEQTLSPQPNDWTNFFARDVAIDNGRAIIGANGEDQQSGAAYMFNINTSPADLDCDGSVTTADLLELLATWGPCDNPDSCPADINNSGAVNADDLMMLLCEWG